MNSLIKNINKVSRPIDFTGLSSGNIHPSDIDAALEINGEYLVLIECKEKGKELDLGQKLLLQNINNNWHSKYRKSIVLVVEHDDLEVIQLKDTTVIKYYFNKEWSSCNENTKQFMKNLFDNEFKNQKYSLQ